MLKAASETDAPPAPTAPDGTPLSAWLTKPARGRGGRPLIQRPDGVVVPYGRASSLGKPIEDEYHLQLWQMRMVMIGTAARPDLIVAANAHRDEREKMNELAEAAKNEARGDAASRTGTALHELIHQFDHGREPYVAEAHRPDIDAYRRATEHLEVLSAEQFGVCDELEVAGTPDQVSRVGRTVEVRDAAGEVVGAIEAGEVVIGDVKSGRTVDFSGPSISAQLSTYARSQRYVFEGNTGDYWASQRSKYPREVPVGRREAWAPGVEVSQRWGLVFHVPQGEGRCSVIPVDLARGRAMADLAREVAVARKAEALLAPTDVVDCSEDFRITAASATTVEELRAAAVRARDLGRWDDDLRTVFTSRRSALELAAAVPA